MHLVTDSSVMLSAESSRELGDISSPHVSLQSIFRKAVTGLLTARSDWPELSQGLQV